MGKKRLVHRPSHDEIMRLAGPMDTFLAKMLSACERALHAAKVGYAQSHEQKYAGEIEYNMNCISCIRWLLSHTQSWARNHLTYDTDTNDV